MSEDETMFNGEQYYPQTSPTTYTGGYAAQNLEPQAPNFLNNQCNNKFYDWEQKQKQILQSMGATQKNPQLPDWAQPVDVEIAKQQRTHQNNASQQKVQQQHTTLQQQKQQRFSAKVQELEIKERELREKFQIGNKNICVEHQRQVEEVWSKAKEVEERYSNNKNFFAKVKELLGDL